MLKYTWAGFWIPNCPFTTQFRRDECFSICKKIIRASLAKNNGSRTWHRSIHMDGRAQGFPAEYCPKHHTVAVCLPSPHLHLGAMCFLGKRHTCTRPCTWYKREHDSSDQAIFFHYSIVPFWCSCVHCWHCWCSTRDSTGTLTGMQPRTQQKLWCIVYSDQFRSEPELTSSAVRATIARLLDWTTWSDQTTPIFQHHKELL